MNNEIERVHPVIHSDDAQLVLREREIPGLSMLLDDDAACAIFKQHLRHFDPLSARCEYLRYKPGVNCLAAFEMGTQHGTIKVYSIAHRVDATDKLEKARSHLLLENSNSTHRVVVSEHSLILSVFPCDDELPALDRLYKCEGSRAFLSRLAPDSNNLHSGNLATLRYKPKRRYVARLDVDGAPAAVLKLHTTADYAQARRAAKSLATLDGVTTAPVLGHSDRHSALLLKWVPGRPLARLLREREGYQNEMQSVGIAIASLHRRSITKLPKRDLAIEIKALYAIAADFETLCPLLVKSANDVVDRCVKQLERIHRPVVPLHGDLHLRQVLVDRDQVSLIDLDNAALDHAESDLGNLIAHLEREFLWGHYDRAHTDLLTEDLVEGYLRNGSRLDLESVYIYTAASLLRLLQEPFRTRQPGWRRRSEMIIERASTILSRVSQNKHKHSEPPERRKAVRVNDPCDLDRDEGLPTAALAIDPERANAELLPLIQDVFQDDSLELRSIRTVRHKPGRRCLVKYTCHSRKLESDIKVLGKIHAKQRHYRSFRMQQELWQSGFNDKSTDGISVPRPIGVIDDWNMWLQEHAAGQNCWDSLQGENGKTVATRVADAVQKLQQVNILTKRVHTVDDELKLLEERLPEVAWQIPRLRSRIESVLSGCRDLAASVSRTTHVGAHRDFYPDQIVVCRDRIFVLDFDLYCMSDAGIDIGNFCAHLIERSVRGACHPTVFLEWERTLLERFAETSEQEHDNIGAFTTLSLARHIHLSTLFPGRRPSTDAIIKACEQRLNVPCH